ncbi:uncharacterized protein TNCV_1438141 [Trichonephila clavipes]|nr:uncharacterized protein TNCV_1438141 [Trichonephila clavipes]
MEASVGGCHWRSTRNGRRDTRCLSAKRLVRVRENTGTRSEGSAFVWTVANEAVGSTRECRMMWRSSRRLVYRGRPGPGLRINDVFLSPLIPAPPHSQIRSTYLTNYSSN